MAVVKKIEPHPDIVNYFKELSFIVSRSKSQKIKPLKNIDLLSELFFHEELNLKIFQIKQKVLSTK